MIKLILICCLFCFSLGAYPLLQRMEEALPYVKNANPHMLVVFDIDYTLTMPSEPAFHMALFKHYKPQIKEWIKPLTEKQKFWLAPFIVIQGHPILIETATPRFISALQQRGVKTLALTACPSGELRAVGNLVEWRIKELKALGIDFSKSFPSVAPFLMTGFKENFGCYPGFNQGILFCNFTPFLKTTDLATKGEVLRKFLEHAEWKPQQVILIDDDAQNLDDLAKSMQEWGVAYTGLLYTGADSIHLPEVSEEAMQQAWSTLVHQVQDEQH